MKRLAFLFCSLICALTLSAQSIVGQWAVTIDQDPNTGCTMVFNLLFNSNGICEMRVVASGSNEVFAFECFGSIPGKYTLTGNRLNATLDKTKYYYRPVKTTFYQEIPANKKREFQETIVNPMDQYCKTFIQDAMNQAFNTVALSGAVSISNTHLSIDGFELNNVNHTDNQAKRFAQSQGGAKPQGRR